MLRVQEMRMLASSTAEVILEKDMDVILPKYLLRKHNKRDALICVSFCLCSKITTETQTP